MSSIVRTVPVNLARRSYDILIGAGNLAELGRFVIERGRTTHAVVITDDNVQDLHAIKATESLVNEGIDTDLISIQPGEPSKSVDLASSLWQGLLELGADRRASWRPLAAAWWVIWPDSSPPLTPGACGFSK